MVAYRTLADIRSDHDKCMIGNRTIIEYKLHKNLRSAVFGSFPDSRIKAEFEAFADEHRAEAEALRTSAMTDAEDTGPSVIDILFDHFAMSKYCEKVHAESRSRADPQPSPRRRRYRGRLVIYCQNCNKYVPVDEENIKWECPSCGLFMDNMKCTRCGYVWRLKSPNRLPDMCANPQCKSPYWCREKIRKEKKKVKE